MARYRWRMRELDRSKATRLQKELNLSQPMAQLLVARGYHDPADA